MFARATILLLAALWSTVAAAQHALVTEGEAPADLYSEETTAFRDSMQPRFGGDALHIRYSFSSGDWYAKANFGRKGDTIRAGSDFVRAIGSDSTQLALGRSWQSGNKSWWKSRTLKTSYEVRENNDGQVLEDKVGAELGMQGQMNSSLTVAWYGGRTLQDGSLADYQRTSLLGSIKPVKSLEVGFAHTVEEKMLEYAELLDAHLTWQIDSRTSLRLAVQEKDIEASTLLLEQADASRGKDLSWSLSVGLTL
ncbi:MAG: hypothetical protein QNI98_06360 [Woeseiaceae bacterium]|nr:hypothetical protein [Woeseiaceae bacterium]